MFNKPCKFPCFLFIIIFFNQNFQVQTKLNQAILTFIATQVLTSQDKDEIRKTFQALDKDCDGFLSSEELIEFLRFWEAKTTKLTIQVISIIFRLGKFTIKILKNLLLLR